MKFGFRVPSLKKRISARLSLKRYIRHNMGLKMPRGTGIISNPKKAIYNKVYRKTTFGAEDVFHSAKSSSNPLSVQNIVCFSFLVWLIIVGITNPAFGIILLIIYYFWSKTPKQQAKKKLAKARKFFNQQDYEEAIKLLNEARKLDSENNNVIYLLGGSCHNFEKYKKAINPFKNFLSKFPEDINVQMALANCYYKTEKYKEAITILQKVPEDFEQYLKIIQLLGACFHAQKKYDLAINVFKRAPLQKRKLDNDLMEVHYNLALIYKDSGNKKNALKHFKKVYAQDIGYMDIDKEIEMLEK